MVEPLDLFLWCFTGDMNREPEYVKVQIYIFGDCSWFICARVEISSMSTY